MAFDKLVDSTQLDGALTATANAIRAKTGSSAGIAWNSSTGFADAVGEISGGGGGDEAAVVFIDYDGTVITTKTKDEINAMTDDSDLPANPSHTGLTAQGWNWTVAQLKAQLTAMPSEVVTVGQMYITTSGATEIDVEWNGGYISPILTIAIKGTISIDWGDGTTPDSETGTSLTTRKAITHTYASAGSYTIKISKTSGTGYAFYGSSSYQLLRKSTSSSENYVYANAVKHIRIGLDVTFSSYGLSYLCALESITIPNYITSLPNYFFYYDRSLKTIILPKNLTNIGSCVFQNCTTLQNISMPSGLTTINTTAFSNDYELKNITLPNGLTTLGNTAFAYCNSLKKIVIPNSVTSIGVECFTYNYSLESAALSDHITTIANKTFYNCYSLRNITIQGSVTSIGVSVFENCYALENITMPNTVTSIGEKAFRYCYALKDFTLPTSLTSIGVSTFSNCSMFKNITLPSGFTSIGGSSFASCANILSILLSDDLTNIGEYAFSNCYSISRITIPSSVTNIDNTAFSSCAGLKEVHVKPESPPTAGSSIFSGTPNELVIYVPQGKLSNYQNASGWNTYASKMQEEPA